MLMYRNVGGINVLMPLTILIFFPKLKKNPKKEAQKGAHRKGRRC